MGTKYSLTGAQKSIWDIEKYYENTCINNISGTLTISDKVDVKILEKAINIFIQENDSMRIKICIVKDKPKQYISKYEYIKLKTKKILNDEMLSKWENDLVKVPIIVTDNLLFRFEIFKNVDGTGGFNATLHHLICDAWSMSLLIDQIMQNYSNLINKTFEKNEIKYSYIDYIKSEKEYMKSSRYIKDKAYWNSVLSKDNYISDINGLHNDTDKSINAKREVIKLSKNFNDKITKFCAENNTSVFTLYCTILQIYMSKVCYNENITIGVPVLNRLNYKAKNTTGMYISTVPFKVDVDYKMKYSEFLTHVAQKQMELFRHQRLPYDCITKIAKKTGNTNMFNIALSYQNARDNKQNSDILYNTNWIFTKQIPNTMDLHICDMDDTGIFDFIYDYNTDILNKEDVLNINERLQYIVEQVINNPNIEISNIQIVLGKDLEKLNKLNSLSEELNLTNVIELIRQQAHINPDKVAIIFENESVTYKKLNEESDKVANYLIQNNITNEVVSMIMTRSINMFYCMFGILKSSNAYLPIDVNYPMERIKYILKDSSVNICITDKNNILKNSKKIKVIEFNEVIDKANKYNTKNDFPSISLDNLAYVIYTSRNY